MQSVVREKEPAVTQGDRRRWWALGATSFALFMSLLDITIVNVAVPVIGSALKASLSSLQWIVAGYTLPLAVLLITGGRLGDIFGRKRWFLIGIGVFTVGSLLCALSGSASLPPIAPMAKLIAARVIQGAGAAVMLPLALAIIASTFHGRERGIAYGVYGGVSALGVAIGPVVGGVLVQRLGWESVFYLNVPIGVLAIVLCGWAIRESRDEKEAKRIDVAGLLTLTIGLTALVLALIEGNDRGWDSLFVLLLFATALLFFSLFAVIELGQGSPMVDFRMFRSRHFTVSCIIGFSLSAALYALLFFISLYLQNLLGFSAEDAGLKMLTLSAPIILFSPLAGALGSKAGPRAVVTIGMVILTASIALLFRMSGAVDTSAWLLLVPAFIGSGIASGLINPPIASLAIDSVSRERAGMAAGVSNVFKQLGTAFGIAFLGAMLQIRYDGSLASGIHAIAANTSAPPQQLDAIAVALQKAGTFVGSTGLRNPPPAFRWMTELSFFHSTQVVVQSAYLEGMRTIFAVAVVLAGAGLLSALTLFMKRRAA